jgi:methylenetetrahydrofolate reductase (NADPH)
MRICELFDSKKPVVSCEIFPPQPDYPVESVFATLEGLSELKPDYISVTYGAGGSSCARSVQIAAKIKNDFSVETLAHLTCVGADRQATDEVLMQLKQENINNVLALRGDLPPEIPSASGAQYHEYAKELIAHIQANHDFCVAAAIYPEGHPRCANLELDRQYLKEKVDAGANFLITQLFFNNQLYYSMMEQLDKMGIRTPVTTGIMPVLNAAQVRRMTELCGASIPRSLSEILSRYGDNPVDMEKAGIDFACKQIVDLVEHGVAGIHLYTMNKPKQTKVILQQTGLRR